MGADMQRREFITLVGGAAATWPLAARAQQPARVYRLGTLTPGLPISATSPLGAVLLGELAQRGYTLGQNLAFDARAAGGEKSRLSQLLLDFQAIGVDAIVVAGYPTAVAAKAAGVPTVVAFGVGDPVATGLIVSLARPGGSITGISDDATTLSTKRLSLLKQLSPKLRRVAMLWRSEEHTSE